jgi:hypothetical protein
MYIYLYTYIYMYIYMHDEKKHINIYTYNMHIDIWYIFIIYILYPTADLRYDDLERDDIYIHIYSRNKTFFIELIYTYI